MDRDALIKAAFCAWNNVTDYPGYDAERAKYPLTWEAWGRVVDSVAAALADDQRTGGKVSRA